jgi:hypothetical protein
MLLCPSILKRAWMVSPPHGIMLCKHSTPGRHAISHASRDLSQHLNCTIEDHLQKAFALSGSLMSKCFSSSSSIFHHCHYFGPETMPQLLLGNSFVRSFCSNSCNSCMQALSVKRWQHRHWLQQRYIPARMSECSADLSHTILSWILPQVLL